MNNKLHYLLERWGEGERRLPDNHTSAKEKALEALQPAEEKITVQHPLRIPWLALACTGLAVVVFFIQKVPSPTHTPQTTKMSESASLKSGLSAFGNTNFYASLPSREPRFNYFQPTPTSDTREFLKTDYHATIKTRSVEKIGNRIQTIVRGYGGRIDSVSIQTRYAYLSFVVPKKTFDAFKTEIKTLLPERFITESSAMQNLLPEKRLIEEKTDMMVALLAEHKKNRNALEIQHRATVASLQKQLHTVVAEIQTLKTEVTTDPVRQKQITERITALQSEQRWRSRNLANENTEYNAKRDMLDAQIQDAQQQLSDLDVRDQTLGETVETVQGSISIDWISIPKIIGLYMPNDWPSLLLLGLGLLTFLSYRRRRMAIELP